MGDRLFIRQPVIEPQGEAKSALWVFKELGTRLGLADFFQYSDEEDYLNQQLAPTGISLDELRLHGSAAFGSGGESDIYSWNTPSGKIDIYSEALLKQNFNPLPLWEDPPQPNRVILLLTGKGTAHPVYTE
jgi:thiosulfate reductase/polysulfide reductase chain A